MVFDMETSIFLPLEIAIINIDILADVLSVLFPSIFIEQARKHGFGTMYILLLKTSQSLTLGRHLYW